MRRMKWTNCLLGGIGNVSDQSGRFLLTYMLDKYFHFTQRLDDCCQKRAL